MTTNKLILEDELLDSECNYDNNNAVNEKYVKSINKWFLFLVLFRVTMHIWLIYYIGNLYVASTCNYSKSNLFFLFIVFGALISDIMGFKHFLYNIFYNMRHNVFKNHNTISYLQCIWYSKLLLVFHMLCVFYFSIQYKMIIIILIFVDLSILWMYLLNKKRIYKTIDLKQYFYRAKKAT
eukprot:425644_1